MVHGAAGARGMGGGGVGVLVLITHKRSRSAKTAVHNVFFYKGRQRTNKGPAVRRKNGFMTTFLSSDSKMERDSSETKEPPLKTASTKCCCIFISDKQRDVRTPPRTPLTRPKEMPQAVPSAAAPKTGVGEEQQPHQRGASGLRRPPPAAPTGALALLHAPLLVRQCWGEGQGQGSGRHAVGAHGRREARGSGSIASASVLVACPLLPARPPIAAECSVPAIALSPHALLAVMFDVAPPPCRK